MVKHLYKLVVLEPTARSEKQINQHLLSRVKRAVFSCNGFSDKQKDDFAFVLRMGTIEAGLQPWADEMPFLCIGMKKGWTIDVYLVSSLL